MFLRYIVKMLSICEVMFACCAAAFPACPEKPVTCEVIMISAEGVPFSPCIFPDPLPAKCRGESIIDTNTWGPCEANEDSLAPIRIGAQ